MLYNYVYGSPIFHCIYNSASCAVIFVINLSGSSLWRSIKNKYNTVSKGRSSKLQRLADRSHTYTYVRVYIVTCVNHSTFCIENFKMGKVFALAVDKCFPTFIQAARLGSISSLSKIFFFVLSFIFLLAIPYIQLCDSQSKAKTLELWHTSHTTTRTSAALCVTCLLPSWQIVEVKR